MTRAESLAACRLVVVHVLRVDLAVLAAHVDPAIVDPVDLADRVSLVAPATIVPVLHAARVDRVDLVVHTFVHQR